MMDVSIRPVSRTVNTRRIATQRIVVDMSGSPQSDRLRQARLDAGYSSAAEAAQAFGWKEAAYRHHENGTRGYGADAARRYGRAFKVKPAWLLGIDTIRELPPQDVEPDRLLVNGTVAAGVWRESEAWNDERRFVIDLPSPFPGARRFGLVLEGLSMDLVYEPGTVLDCISIFKNGVEPKTGDHVIVERIGANGLRELTVKEYRQENGTYTLVPRSSRPEFKPVEYRGPDEEGTPIGGELVHVIAFVVADYPPRVQSLMRRMGILKDVRSEAAE